MCEKELTRRSFVATAGIFAAFPAGAIRSAEPAAPALSSRLERLADWIADSFQAGQINLVPNLPSGKTHAGRQRIDLKHLYWLQNCNLFAMTALRRYDKELSHKIERSYRLWYQKTFPDVPEQTEHYLPLGKLPGLDVPEGKYLRAVIKVKDYGRYRIGTETHDPSQLGEVRADNPKVLLKNGLLRELLRGRKELALKYFDQAMRLWDGGGFRERRTEEGRYHTRCLAYALIAERALRTRMPTQIHEQVESRLWACQDGDGGIWTDYNADGTIPGLAKKTNEIAPLTLLAYDQGIWP